MIMVIKQTRSKTRSVMDWENAHDVYESVDSEIRESKSVNLSRTVHKEALNIMSLSKSRHH